MQKSDERRTLLDRLLGREAAETVDRTITKLDETLENAKVEHKALAEDEAGELADAIMQLVMDQTQEPEAKRNALIAMLVELTSQEVVEETEAAPEAAAAGMAPPDEDQKAMPELVLKLIDEQAELAGLQSDLITRVDTLIKAMETLPAAMKTLQTEVGTLKTYVTKPRIASKATETVIENPDPIADDDEPVWNEVIGAYLKKESR